MFNATTGSSLFLLLLQQLQLELMLELNRLLVEVPVCRTQVVQVTLRIRAVKVKVLVVLLFNLFLFMLFNDIREVRTFSIGTAKLARFAIRCRDQVPNHLGAAWRCGPITGIHTRAFRHHG